MKFNNKSMYLYITLFIIILLPTQGFSNGFPCKVNQENNNLPPILESSCPIGSGLWHDKKPKNIDSVFWIQCGMFRKPFFLNDLSHFHNKISYDILLKPDEKLKADRCLIGPIEKYDQAKDTLRIVQSIKGFENAFLREVFINSNKINKDTISSKHNMKNINNSEKKNFNGDPISIRMSKIVKNLQFSLPYVTSTKIPFYVENNQAWNRLNYVEATEVCEYINMRLPSHDEWKNLLLAEFFIDEKLPKDLPYWGHGEKGLLLTGKSTIMPTSSRLNIICVNERSN